MTQAESIMCALIRKALWEEESDELERLKDQSIWGEVHNEVKEQALELLLSDILRSFVIPDEVKQDWRMDNYTIASQNVQLLSFQRELDKVLSEKGISYTVLKGSAAAFYYPKPLYRTMGDIDIIVQDKDFERTYTLLEEKYGKPIIGSVHNKGVREYVFSNGQAAVELHREFAILSDAEKESLLDSLIKDAIPRNSSRMLDNKYKFSMLPPMENGFVLLAHIAQHMEGGLGLRQIIDWMLYVDQYLGDEEWPDFCIIAKRLGLERLARTVTRMCQLYLGLSEKNCKWAKKAEKDLCDELMEFVLTCGNFGRKQGMHNSVAVVVSQNPNIITLFKNLQQRGEKNWRALKKHPWLRSVAWMYQALRYMRKGFGRKNALRELQKDKCSGKKRRKMLEKLGTTRTY